MRIHLPTESTDDLLMALDDMLSPAITERNIQSIAWWTAYYYMRGIRDFNVVDYRTGALQFDYHDELGALDFRWEELTRKMMNEIGRLSDIDTRPHALQHRHGLNALRDSSISQVIQDHIISGINFNQFNMEFLTHLVMFGTVGLALSEEPIPGTFFGLDPELCPPWELMGLPTFMDSRAEEVGIVRRRRVSLEWLRSRAKKLGMKVPDENVEDLRIEWRPYGYQSARMAEDSTAVSGAAGGDLFSVKPRDRQSKHGPKNREMDHLAEPFVILSEIMCWGPRNSVERVIVRAGDLIIGDTHKRGTKVGAGNVRVPRPIGVARYTDVLGWYGRGFPELNIPLADQVEQLLAALFENIGDLDRFGYVFIPTNQGINVDDLKLTEGPRIAMWEPDFTNDRIRPFNLQPANTGPLPGQVAQLATSVLDKQTGQGEIQAGEAPGRVDSAKGIATLSQLSTNGLKQTASSIEQAYANLYNCTLFKAKRMLEKNPQIGAEVISISDIDTALVGVNMNTDDGVIGMSLSKDANPIPEYHEVHMTIKSIEPVNKMRERMEAMQMLQFGRYTWEEFVIDNYKYKWGFKLGNRAIWESYRRAVLENLILFADGRAAGLQERMAADQALGGRLTPDSTMSTVQLLVLTDFMNTPEFMMAEQPVRQAFTNRKQFYERMKNPGLPQGMPNIDQAAEMAQGQGRQQPQMAMAG